MIDNQLVWTNESNSCTPLLAGSPFPQLLFQNIPHSPFMIFTETKALCAGSEKN